MVGAFGKGHTCLNNTISRTHNQRPKDVFLHPKLAWNVYEHLYLPKKEEQKKPRNHKRDFDPKKLPKVGNYVRISRLRHPFEKDSNSFGLFSREILEIIGVNHSQKIPMYTLKDLRKSRNPAASLVKGKFYPSEIQKISYNPNLLFEVDKILARKIVNGERQLKVRWKGYT